MANFIDINVRILYIYLTHEIITDFISFSQSRDITLILRNLYPAMVKQNTTVCIILSFFFFLHMYDVHILNNTLPEHQRKIWKYFEGNDKSYFLYNPIGVGVRGCVLSSRGVCRSLKFPVDTEKSTDNVTINLSIRVIPSIIN